MKNHFDFTDLVNALQEGDAETINKCSKILYEQLMNYLRFHMKASKADAEDCVQDALLTSFDIAKKGHIKEPALFYFYVRKICYNNFLNLKKKETTAYLEEMITHIVEEPSQIQNLVDQEKMQYLVWCIDQLKKDHRAYIQYWYDHPDSPTKKVAEHFDISLSNAWTKKHRIIRQLHECHQKKINQ